MVFHQLKIEFKKYLTFNRVMIMLGIVLIPFALQLYILRNGYTFTSEIDLYQRLLSGFIPMLFPVLMVMVFADTFINELKNNYIIYTRTRVNLKTYLISKVIVNGVLSFIVAFLIAFIPFIIAVYINPYFSILNSSSFSMNSDSGSTFNQLLIYGDFIYGFIYSSWVGVNGILYATLPLLLAMAFNNYYIALSLPFVFYHLFNFVTGVLNFARFSPLSTIFPYNLTQMPIWTVFIPFSFILIVVIAIIIYLNKRNIEKWLF